MGFVLNSKFVKSGLKGGYLSKFYDLKLDAKTIEGSNDALARNSFIAYELLDAFAKYYDPKQNEFQAVSLRFTVPTMKNKQEILDYYAKNPNSMFVPVEGTDKRKKELVFRLNTEFFKAKEDFLTDVAINGFDLKRLFPFFNTNIEFQVGEGQQYKSYKNNTDFWNPINIIRNKGFEELSSLQTMLDYASSPKATYSFESKEYSDTIKNLNGKKVSEILAAIPENTTNYFLKTLRYSLEASLQMSKSWINF